MTSLATITYKNQLTIPKEIVEALGFEKTRKVLVSVKNKTLVVKPLVSQVELLAGSLAKFASGKTTDLKKIRQVTKRKVTSKIAKEGL